MLGQWRSWGVLCSHEVKDFGFVVFHNKASIDKDF